MRVCGGPGGMLKDRPLTSTASVFRRGQVSCLPRKIALFIVLDHQLIPLPTVFFVIASIVKLLEFPLL